MLKIHDYCVSVGDKPILKDISFDFEEGKTYVIMGPNGSGKSTLALSLIGSPDFTISKGAQALLRDENILDLPTEKRIQAGLFATFQSPPSLSGVTVFQMLRVALEGKNSPQDLRARLLAYAKELAIPETLLSRSLNDGFSGGERKKMEMLQMALLEPKVIIFDEIDTGVDVDALQTIFRFAKEHKKPSQVSIFITHQTRIANLINPDAVLILKDGHIAKTGDASLIEEIGEKGYKNM